MKSQKGFLIIAVALFILILGINTVLAIENPAAVYCTELGYQYEVSHTSNGDVGLCYIDKENVTLNAWSFFVGQEGQNYSYCKKMGYGITTLSDGKNPYSINYSACVINDSNQKSIVTASSMSKVQTDDTSPKLVSVVDLMNLQEKVQTDVSPESFNNLSSKNIISSNALISSTSTSIPSSFDWNNYNGKNWLTPAKDQGICGSCWAFASVGAVEANTKIWYNEPNVNPDLSEEYLVSDCSGTGNCQGTGDVTKALDFIKNKGIPDESCMPYVDGGVWLLGAYLWGGCSENADGTCGSSCTYRINGACSDATCSDRCSDWQSRLTKINEYTSIGSNSADIKKALIERGPVVAVMAVDGDYSFWDAVYGNIYKCGNNHLQHWHAVDIVGYNDAGNYWIIKNSWGWLNNFFSMGSKVGYGECGLGTSGVYSIGIDTDGDGVSDYKDSCPNSYGTYCNGCLKPSCQSGYSSTCPLSGQPYCIQNPAPSCTTPTNGMVISQNTVLCSGSYNLPNGIQVNTDNIILDCNGAKLIGNLSGKTYGFGSEGIWSYGKGVTIKNCILTNFSYGIYSYSNNLVYTNLINNTIKWNFAGIYISGLHKILNSTISNCVSGIQVSSNINGNVIKNNNIFSNSAYNIGDSNYGGVTDATNNYYGTTNQTEIQNKISGNVTFIPYSTTSVGGVICSSDVDCNDNNPDTIDKCINPGLSNSSCSICTPTCFSNATCGTNGFVGTQICSNNKVYRNYTTYSCNNQGTCNTFCSSLTSLLLFQDCGNNSCTNFGNNYCKGNAVYHNQSCNIKGCSVGSCTNNSIVNETLVANCVNICLDGICAYENMDKDKDGFCQQGYLIKNVTSQCPKENGIYGTDCNDNDVNILPPYDYMSISNNTILCNGNFNVSKGISINDNNIILDCNYSTINSNDDSGSNAISVWQKNNITIKNCIIKNFTTSSWRSGIYLYNSNNSLIINNILESNSQSILLSSSNLNKIINNTVNKGSIGVFISGSQQNYIANNKVINPSTYAYFVGFQSNLNSFINNSGISTESTPYYILSLQSGAINNYFESNVFSGGDNYGIMLHQGDTYGNDSYNTFIANIIYRNSEGVSVGGDYNNFTKNILYNQTYSAFSMIGINNLIWNNTISNNPISDYNFSRNSYCLNGIGNKYFDGASGPICDCITNLINTSWSDWANLSCLSSYLMNQSRTLVQYDLNSCPNYQNETTTEYRAVQYCDFCTPSLLNTSWSDWQNISCLSNNLMNQSRHLIQYDSNSCPNSLNKTIYEYHSDITCGLNTTTDFLSINNPNGMIYSQSNIIFNISTLNISDKIDYIDYSDKSPRWSTLCTKCSNFGLTKKQTKSFSDGNHILVFRSTKNGTNQQKNISLFIDSKKPQIISTTPSSNSYTNGNNFLVKYNENNLNVTKLVYGTDIMQRLDCPNGTSKSCYFNPDLAKYNGDMQYYFILTDISGNTIQSKSTKVHVDTIIPVINNPTSFWNQSGRYINFNLSINEINFASINYIDNSAKNPRWATLCSNLNKGLCIKKVNFNAGVHNLTIQVLDKAGNYIQKNINLSI